MTMKGNRRTKTLLLAACAALAIVPAISHAQATARKISYNIAAQDLGTALTELARQSNREIYFSADLTRGKRAPRLAGNLSIDAALRRLLDGSGLGYTIKPSGSIVIETRRQTARQPASTGGAMQSSGEVGASQDDGAAASNEGGEIVVTGTNIRGRGPVGSNVISFDRDKIEETGFVTVEDFIKTVPQNFNATQIEIGGSGGNFNRGVGANLRGLGTGATLTLINGRRQALGGDGDYVDLSTIPTSAIQRFEILTDGASAIYGSDAIGGVINVILRKDFNGAEVSARSGFGKGFKEYNLSATFGRSWSTGNFLVGYQFYHRDNLPISERPYAGNADKRAFGGTDLRQPFSNPGNIYNAAFQPFYAIPTGQNGVGLTVAQLVPGTKNLAGTLDGSDLLPETDTHSLFLVASQELSSRFKVFAEGRFSVRDTMYKTLSGFSIFSVPSTNPFYVNPVGGSRVTVAYNFIDDLGNFQGRGATTTYAATVGAEWHVSDKWRVTGYGQFSEQKYRFTLPQLNTAAVNAALADPNPATALNIFGDGSNTNPATLAKLTTLSSNNGSSNVKTANILADGPLFALPGGDVRLALGGEYRRESLNSLRTRVPLGRSVTAAFGEIVVPFVSEQNRSGGFERLELSVAARYENASDFGDSVNPKVGLSYSPFSALTLRGTWGTSFRAPRLYDLNPISSGQIAAVTLSTMADPSSPTGTSVALVSSGGSSKLREETARTWTAGFDFAPKWLDGFKFSGTYYHINYDDRIIQPASPSVLFDVLRLGSIYAPIINRSPSASTIASLCTQLVSGSCAATPPTIVITNQLQNIADLTTSGVDIGLTGSFQTALGRVGIYANANRIFDYKQRITPTSPLVELVDTITNPPKFRARGGLDLTSGRVSVNMAVSYLGDMNDNFNNRRISSWTTFDAGFVYRVPDNEGWARGLELSVRGSNIFNTSPPFVNLTYGFDISNASPLGRLITLQIRKRW